MITHFKTIQMKMKIMAENLSFQILQRSIVMMKQEFKMKLLIEIQLKMKILKFSSIKLVI